MEYRINLGMGETLIFKEDGIYVNIYKNEANQGNFVAMVEKADIKKLARAL